MKIKSYLESATEAPKKTVGEELKMACLPTELLAGSAGSKDESIVTDGLSYGELKAAGSNLALVAEKLKKSSQPEKAAEMTKIVEVLGQHYQAFAGSPLTSDSFREWLINHSPSYHNLSKEDQDYLRLVSKYKGTSVKVIDLVRLEKFFGKDIQALEESSFNRFHLENLVSREHVHDLAIAAFRNCDSKLIDLLIEKGIVQTLPVTGDTGLTELIKGFACQNLDKEGLKTLSKLIGILESKNLFANNTAIEIIGEVAEKGDLSTFQFLSKTDAYKKIIECGKDAQINIYARFAAREFTEERSKFFKELLCDSRFKAIPDGFAKVLKDVSHKAPVECVEFLLSLPNFREVKPDGLNGVEGIVYNCLIRYKTEAAKVYINTQSLSENTLKRVLRLVSGNYGQVSAGAYDLLKFSDADRLELTEMLVSSRNLEKIPPNGKEGLADYIQRCVRQGKKADQISAFLKAEKAKEIALDGDYGLGKILVEAVKSGSFDVEVLKALLATPQLQEDQALEYLVEAFSEAIALGRAEAIEEILKMPPVVKELSLNPGLLRRSPG
ncbi:MAG: hypothetical protein S4CHLAM37_14980 [Chlamydiia bacterium]|nr:hypothetical protein [Chlamydiia bacterium]